MGSKGQVDVTFSGNSQEAVQAADALRKALALVGENSTKTAKKSNDDWGKMALTFFSVGSAIQVVDKALGAATQAMEGYFRRIDDRAETLLGKLNEVSSALGKMGSPQFGPQARKDIASLSNVGGRLVNPQIATDIYSQTAKNFGFKLNPDTNRADLLAATRAGLLQYGISHDAEQASGVAGNYAELAAQRRPGGGLDGQSDEQLTNMAAALQEGGVNLGPPALRFLGEAPDKKWAVQVLLAAAQVDESNRKLNTIQEFLDADPKSEIFRSGQYSKLRNMTAGQRLASIIANPSEGPETLQLAFKALEVGRSRIGPMPDLESQAQAVAGSTDPYQQAQNQQSDAEARTELAKRGGELTALRTKTAATNIHAYLEANHPIISDLPGSGFVVNIIAADEAATISRTEGEREALARIHPKHTGMGADYVAGYNQLVGAAGLTGEAATNFLRTDYGKSLDQVQADLLKQIADGINALNATVQQRSPRQTALKTDHPGN